MRSVNASPINKPSNKPPDNSPALCQCHGCVASPATILLLAPAQRLLLAVALAFSLLAPSRMNAQTGAILSTESPIQFFTNLASRLVAAELNINLGRLPVHPTNQYTPTLHRLLQVTANLYDATTTNDWPTVFRPLFRTDGSNVFIVGYRELTDAQLQDPAVGVMLDPSDAVQLQRIPPLGSPDQGALTEPLVVGIPEVIGAKKGLPNFNEFSLQTIVRVYRKLLLKKSSPSVVTLTNQMYFISISNLCAVEVWNSYTSTYPRGLKLSVAVNLTAVLSNQGGAIYSRNDNFAASYPSLASTGWPMPALVSYDHRRYTVDSQNPSDFFVPLRTNVLFLPTSQYRGTNTPSPLPLETAWPVAPTGFPVPDLKLLLFARVRYSLVDTELNRIIDCVNLDNLTQSIDLTTELFTESANDVMTGMWLTNRPQSSARDDIPTTGVINQLRLCLGLTAVSISDWNNYGLQPMSSQDKAEAIDVFRQFMGFSPLYPTNITYTGLAMETPFNPVRKLLVETTWQANDPLVHYTTSDLGRTSRETVIAPPSSTNNPVLANVGRLNWRTKPWGGNPNDVPVVRWGNLPSWDTNAFQLQIKDPLVWRSDDWDFPTNASLDLRWLGRVHRGTPWQTIYLKSAAVAPPLWQAWIGNWDASDALASQPTADWRLASLLVSLLNTNPPQHLLSVNASAPTAWLAAFDGLNVVTNTSSDTEFRDPRFIGRFAPLVMDSNSPLATVIAAAISQMRSQQPGQFFRTIGDLLATPALTLASPWLNATAVQQQLGLSDEAYEIIPEQLLPRLRPDSIGTLTPSAKGSQLQFTGFDAASYAIEYSLDLVNWTVLGTNTPTNGVFHFALPTGSEAPAGFYRSALLP